MRKRDYYNSRNLGKIESFFASLTRIRLFNNFACVVEIESPLNYQDRKALLSHTLQNIFRAFPLLVCNVFEDQIKIIDSLEFKELVHFWNDEEPLEKTLSKLNDFRFEYNNFKKVLFKIFIIDGTKIAFLFDHAIYDGMSSLFFLKLFLRELNLRSEEILQPLIDDDLLFQRQSLVMYPLPPPIEDMVDYLRSEEISMGQKVDRKGSDDPPNKQPSVEVWKSDKLYLDNGHIFKIINFTPQESLEVKEICKDHGVTITPFIQSCFIVAQTRVLKDEKDMTLSNEITLGINTRRYIPEEYDFDAPEIGCNVSGYFLKLPSSENLNWEEVKRESNLLKQLTSDGSILIPFGEFLLLAGMNWDHAHLQNSILNGKNTRGNLEVTNLGFTDFQQNEKDQFKLKRVYFAQSTFNLGFVFSINIVSDVHGMGIIASMVENDEFTEAQFEEICHGLKKILLNPDLKN